MRWRELFAKYRWTINHNDLNEKKKTFEYMDYMNELFGKCINYLRVFFAAAKGFWTFSDRLKVLSIKAHFDR